MAEETTVVTVPGTEEVPVGLSMGDMDKLMSELLPATPIDESKSAEQGWDKMTLLTGGFVPVGSIFWARPPKLRSQQKILLALEEAENKGAVQQADIVCTLAAELFYVREGNDFRKATEEEIGGDEVGMTAQAITEVLLRLMDINTENASGNA